MTLITTPPEFTSDPWLPKRYDPESIEFYCEHLKNSTMVSFALSKNPIHPETVLVRSLTFKKGKEGIRGDYIVADVIGPSINGYLVFERRCLPHWLETKEESLIIKLICGELWAPTRPPHPTNHANRLIDTVTHVIPPTPSLIHRICFSEDEVVGYLVFNTDSNPLYLHELALLALSVSEAFDSHTYCDCFGGTFAQVLLEDKNVTPPNQTHPRGMFGLGCSMAPFLDWEKLGRPDHVAISIIKESYRKRVAEFEHSADTARTTYIPQWKSKRHAE